MNFTTNFSTKQVSFNDGDVIGSEDMTIVSIF